MDGSRSGLFLGFDFAGRLACIGPSFEASRIGDFDPLSCEGFGDDTRARAGAAIQDDFFARIFFEKGLPVFLRTIEIALGEQRGRGDDAGVGPFGGLADIDENSFALGDELRGGGGFELGNFGGKNETGGGDQEGDEAGEFHGFKITRDLMVEAIHVLRKLGSGLWSGRVGLRLGFSVNSGHGRGGIM